MASRGRTNKLPPTRGRGRIIKSGHLAAQSERRRHQPIPPVQPTPPPVQPTPPLVQPTPQPVQPTPPPSVQPLPPSVQPSPPPSVQPSPPSVQPTRPSLQPSRLAFTKIPTPGWHDLSATYSQQPIPSVQLTPSPSVYLEEDEGDAEIEDMQQDHDEIERDANGKYIIRPFGKGLSPASVATDALGTAIRQHFLGPYLVGVRHLGMSRTIGLSYLQ
ncbi:Proline rich extensin signature [Sesbania bispinosa]|nr:Proline rich extensin signature [Sesbania bispinosa]